MKKIDGTTSSNNNEQELKEWEEWYDNHCKEYEDFFGEDYKEFMDRVPDDVTPERAARILMEAEEIDYCPSCDYYYFRHGPVYYCPSCYSLGDCSKPDKERY